MKGLRCGIFQDKGIGNCSNHGISSRCSNVTLLGVKYANGDFMAMDQLSAPDDIDPAVIIEERELAGGTYYTAYPYDSEGNKLPGWWMMGGCYIKTSDSRFPFKYPIPLHDRQE
jgi:hypothetical protein